MNESDDTLSEHSVAIATNGWRETKSELMARLSSCGTVYRFEREYMHTQ